MAYCMMMQISYFTFSGIEYFLYVVSISSNESVEQTYYSKKIWAFFRKAWPDILNVQQQYSMYAKTQNEGLCIVYIVQAWCIERQMADKKQ